WVDVAGDDSEAAAEGCEFVEVGVDVGEVADGPGCVGGEVGGGSLDAGGGGCGVALGGAPGVFPLGEDGEDGGCVVLFGFGEGPVDAFAGGAGDRGFGRAWAGHDEGVAADD